MTEPKPIKSNVQIMNRQLVCYWKIYIYFFTSEHKPDPINKVTKLTNENSMFRVLDAWFALPGWTVSNPSQDNLQRSAILRHFFPVVIEQKLFQLGFHPNKHPNLNKKKKNILSRSMANLLLNAKRMKKNRSAGKIKMNGRWMLLLLMMMCAIYTHTPFGH